MYIVSWFDTDGYHVNCHFQKSKALENLGRIRASKFSYGLELTERVPPDTNRRLFI